MRKLEVFFYINCIVLCNLLWEYEGFIEGIFCPDRKSFLECVIMKRNGGLIMAKRRCISVDVYESEDFYLLSDKAKVLYTHFILRSDDEGVVINPGSAMRMCSVKDDVLRELIESGFVLDLDEVYVITHWHVHNHIQPSKKTPSIFSQELSTLTLNEKKIYAISGGKNPDQYN